MSFACTAEPSAAKKRRYWLPGLGSPMKIAPTKGESSAGVLSENVPILELSGQATGASLAKLPRASGQAVWPSAASGLIVRPGGSVTFAVRSCEGDGERPKN